MKFIPLFRLADGGAGAVETSYTEAFGRRAGAGGDEEVGAGLSVKRAVERGSKIVTVVPSATSLVLQMPRGNLETICPRPLVLRVVRLDLDRCVPTFSLVSIASARKLTIDFVRRSRYRAAFLSCRRHRIDLNILYDHSPSPFRSHLTEFVNQVHEVDYLNLFLSGLKEEDVTETMYKPLVPADKSGATVKKVDDGENKVNVVCELVLEELSKRDVFEYANTVLTAHVRKRPPNYEEALRVLVELKGVLGSLSSCLARTDERFDFAAKDAARAEDAVKYIIFLSDANKLFDLALGMYDFPLVLMIAQHSQKVRPLSCPLPSRTSAHATTIFSGSSRVPPLPPRTPNTRPLYPTLQDRRSSRTVRFGIAQPRACRIRSVRGGARIHEEARTVRDCCDCLQRRSDEVQGGYPAAATSKIGTS